MRGKGEHGWRFARVAGIEIRAHVSLILLLAYVLLVATAQAPAVASRAGTNLSALSVGPAGIGGLFALGLFISVLLHELGHAFVAKAMHVRVRSITLMMLGGITDMERIPESKYAEFGIAVVGPAVSIALALLFGWIGRVSSNPEAQLFGYWLGQTNWALAIFNLLPAFPLDGGRALRSVLAAREGRLRGTQHAVTVSKGLAWFFGAVGVLQFNIILLLIAFFIYSVAQSELFLLQGRTLLNGIAAGALSTKAPALDSSLTLTQAAERMLAARATVVPIEETTATGEKRYGTLSLDMIRRIPRSAWTRVRAHQLMELPENPLREDRPLGDAVAELVEARSGALPLVDSQGNLTGVVRLSDLIDTLKLRSLRPEPVGEPPEEKKSA